MSGVINKTKSLPIQIKASFWFLICSFLQKGISVITTPIFTRIMSADDYGRFGVFSAWLGIFTIIVSLNLYAGVHAQGIIKFSNEREQFTSSLLGLTTTLVIIWTIVYLLFRSQWNRFFSLTTPQMISMMIIIWTSAVFGFWANEQRALYAYKPIVIVTVIVSVAKPLVEMYLVIFSSDKASARVLGWALVELIAYSWMFALQFYRGKVFFSRRFWKYGLAFNTPLIMHYLSQTILNNSDRIMIQRLIGEREAGIYNLAYAVSLIMTLFNTALMQTISPWMYQKIKDKRGKEMAPIAYSSMVIVAVSNICLIILAPEIITVFAPSSYYEAIHVIPPIAMSVFFMYTYDLFAKYAFYYERTIIIMIASITSAALNIVLNYVFIRKFGYIAAGYTTLICFAIYAIAHYLFMRMVCKIHCEKVYPYNTKIIVLITAIFLITGFSVSLIYELPVLRYGLFLVFVICAVVMRKEITKVIKGLLDLKSY